MSFASSHNSQFKVIDISAQNTCRVVFCTGSGSVGESLLVPGPVDVLSRVLVTTDRDISFCFGPGSSMSRTSSVLNENFRLCDFEGSGLILSREP